MAFGSDVFVELDAESRFVGGRDHVTVLPLRIGFFRISEWKPPQVWMRFQDQEVGLQALICMLAAPSIGPQ